MASRGIHRRSLQATLCSAPKPAHFQYHRLKKIPVKDLSFYVTAN